MKPSPPVRVCIFGAAPAPQWLRAVAANLPSGSEPQSLPEADAVAALRAAAKAFPGDDLVLLRTGTALPVFWYERLTRALDLPDVLVAAPLDNLDPARSPLPAGRHSDADTHTIDTLCYAHGRHQAIDWPTFSPLLSIWRGVSLRGIDLAQIHKDTLPSQFAPARAVLLDHLYVADPDRPLRAAEPVAPGADPQPPSALGELREALAAALAQPAAAHGYPGLDAKPVVLHVLHGWGGGAERFVRDLASVDSERHHLVLIARGNFARRRYGETVELHHATLASPPLRRIDLPDPITSTAFGNRLYAAFLAAIVRDYGVDAMVVSSLIGHSLDAMRSGLPTVFFVHDFYPLWPLLHRNLDDASLRLDAAQLSHDLAHADAGFEFAERDPAYWLALREAVADAAIAARAKLIAPSRAAMDIFLRLQPRLSTLQQSIISHGIAPWPSSAHLPLSAPPVRTRLRLIVLGRVRRGKAAHLLRELLPGLSEHAELFLLGAGPESNEFFGQPDVHILLNYRHDELAALLAKLAPDAALILPNFAETFSYTLSELRSFGIPVIATRLGALTERIDDGSDGFLVAPEPTAILATVARLHRERGLLAGVRAALAKIPLRTLADMAADYRDALPRIPALRAISVPTAVSPDRVVAQTRAAVLGDLERHIAGSKLEIAAQQNELNRRAEWAFGLDAQLKRSGVALTRLQSEFSEHQERAQTALHQLQGEFAAHQTRAQTALRKLQGEFAERTAWALQLDADLQALRREREQLLASVSWRITKPLRYALRKFRGLRVRLRYLLDRARANLHRTRGSLAGRGMTATLKRAAAEFRRDPPIAPLAVTAPSDDFAAFAVPCAATPRVSIVIPVFNKFAYTAACLRALAEHAGAVPFETIIVDDASTDATPDRLAQIGGVRVVRNAQNLGFVGSCNAGAAAANGEFIVFLNNDTVVTSGWLEALLACFEQEPDCGLVGAKLVYPDGRLQEAGGLIFADGSGWNYGRFEDPADPRFNFRRETDYCSGAAIALHRDFFNTLGGFDVRYAPAYYEDTDLAFAVRATGKKVFYEPRALVVHFEGITAGTDTTRGMKRFQAVNHTKFVEKWKNALARQPAPIHDAIQADLATQARARGHVLIVDAYTPTPDQDSGSLRMLNLLRLLREAGYAVSFLPDNRAHAGQYTQALQALGVEALYHPFVSDPVAWLRARGGTLDAVVLSRHYVAAKYVGPVRLYAPRARLIFDTVDVHHLREQRAAELEGSVELAQQAARTRVQELKLIRECDVSVVVSATEKQLLERELPRVRIEVLSNVHAVYGRRREFDPRRDLVFVGGFQHPPNVDAVLWFVHDVFPLVRASLPDVVFHVIGSKAPKSILELAHDGVTIHGFAEDIAPFMDDCRLSVAPLRYGAGVKGKVNMAMSYGLPVVATTPAVEGMHVRDGEEVLIADSPAEFAAAIGRAYADATLWKKLSDNGLANVRAHFSFDAARAALHKILD